MGFAGENGRAIVVCIGADAVNFRFDGGKFAIQRGALRGRQAAVRASVASVTARSSSVVTWDSAPSATCNSPTPSVGIARRLRQRRDVGLQTLEMARPAGRQRRC